MNLNQAAKLANVTVACLRARINRGAVDRAAIEAAKTKEEIIALVPPKHAGPRDKKPAEPGTIDLSDCAREVGKSIWVVRRLIKATGAPFYQVGRSVVIKRDDWEWEWKAIIVAPYK
jgi:hypothetical protein